MNNVDTQYHALLEDILDNGVIKSDRTGTGTISVFGRQFRHNMREGFPLLTTKKMAIKTMMTELKWFLKGDTNIKYLVDNGCNIWNGDAYKAYQNAIAEVGLFDAMMGQEEFIERIKTDDEFAMQWGELGPIYGKQWRHWLIKDDIDNSGEYIWADQIAYLIEQLKDNPDSRRLMVNAWNVGSIPEMALPPCHYGFQVYTRVLRQNERWTWYQKKTGSTMHHDHIEQEMDQEGVPTRAISLAWNQRSVDTFLGLPFNIASYATLLELLAHETNMVADELVGNLGDTHLYLNHIDAVHTQLENEPHPLPRIELSNVRLLDGEFDYEIIDYVSAGRIKAPLSN
jgi:thymidylate synthase